MLVRREHGADRVDGNIEPLGNFFHAATAGSLPAVSWVVPSGPDSDHPPASVHRGQAYVTALINAIMHVINYENAHLLASAPPSL